jgi:RND superfamily putative drug exporter
MVHLARLAIRRPLAALITATAAVVALALVGLGLTGAVSPSITTVPGTQAYHAEHLVDAEFGPSVLVPILLEGPQRQVDRQGPALVRELGRRRDTRVLSAWDAGDTGRRLRKNPTQALIVAAVARDKEAMVKTHQDEIDRAVDKIVAAPVRAAISGTPTLDRAMRDEAIETTRTGAAIALPVAFVLLLVLLRAPVVALMLSVMGAATAFAGLGLITLLGEVMDVDAIAAVLGTSTGMALSIAYGLFFYRRWRREVEADVARHDAAHAATEAVHTSGRAILIGGTALTVTLIVAAALTPPHLLPSLGIGAMLVSMLAIGAAVVIMPAALVLLGHRHAWLSFGYPAWLVRPWAWLESKGGWVVRNAVPAGALATAILAAAAFPALALKTGPPTPRYLPEDNQARQDFERIAHVMGAGMPTPFNIVVVSKHKPLTDRATLRRIERFERSLRRDKRVASVVGPGVFAATSRDLKALPDQLDDMPDMLRDSSRKLKELETGLGRAGDGAAQLQSGLANAASGADRLRSGSGSAQSGASRLRAGLDQARAGALKISGGLGTALGAARQLRDGAGAALKGAQQISGGLGEAAKAGKAGAPIVAQMAADIAAGAASVKGVQGAADQLAAQVAAARAEVAQLAPSPGRDQALGALSAAAEAASGLKGSVDAATPKLDGAAGVAKALSGQIAELSKGLAQLHAGSTQLQAGIGKLQSGNSRLAAGIDKLSGGGGQLTEGITKLRDGAGRLEAGLGQLTGGAGQLASGLSGGTGPAGELAQGLKGGEKEIGKFAGKLPSPEDLERLQRESPGLFDSGYFVLAAIAGAPADQQRQASFAVNLERGGSAGQIQVVSKSSIESGATQALGEDLKARADAFARASGLEVAVGGPAGALGDFRTDVGADVWPVVIGAAVVVGLMLMAFMRAIVLPAVAVAFDLLTTAAAFGLLTLLFTGDDPLLGGPGYIDPMTTIAIFAAVFGMTMIYEVLLLQRTRDHFLAGGDAREALRHGLRGTAAAGTGAALAMLAIVVPFAASDLVIIRQLGVGIAIAVLLDALIVRPVLLPAAVAVLGRWSWWPASRRARAAEQPRADGAPPLSAAG